MRIALGEVLAYGVPVGKKQLRGRARREAYGEGPPGEGLWGPLRLGIWGARIWERIAVRRGDA